jgi:hypothetical protein
MKVFRFIISYEIEGEIMRYSLIKIISVILLTFILIPGCRKKNRPPYTPCSPSGSTIGVVYALYRFGTRAIDPNGDSIAIRFDWGDGDTSKWSDLVESDEALAMLHSWSVPANYNVKVQAKDKNELYSKWSLPLIIEIAENQPLVVSTPSGPLTGSVNTSYQFSCLAIDPYGDDVAIRFDWGDGDTSTWSNLVPSCSLVTMSHSWHTLDTFQIKAQAMDKEGFTSEWSLPHSIEIIELQPLRWKRRCGHTSVVFDSRIWVIGGMVEDSLNYFHYVNDVWYSTDGVNWTCATNSAEWSPRAGHTSIVFDNKIWVLGGIDEQGTKGDVWFSLNGANWTCATESAPWSPKYGHTSVVFDNKMWVLGGCEAPFHEKNDVWFSSDGASWICATDSAEWPSTSYHTSVVFDNKIWIIGGTRSVNGWVDFIWYSLDGVNWTCVTDPARWSRRYGHASVVFDNKIWGLGGTENMDWPINYFSDVWYSINGLSWNCATSLASWPARAFFTSVVFDNKIWVLGGKNLERCRNDVWFSSDGVNWSQTVN